MLTSGDAVAVLLDHQDSLGMGPGRELEPIDLETGVIRVREAEDANVQQGFLLSFVLEEEDPEVVHRRSRLCNEVGEDLDVDRRRFLHILVADEFGEPR
jgi:hypothetical protein